jgi:hypothetical protein
MRLAITAEAVYQVVSDPDYSVDERARNGSCTARGIAARMGYDEMEPDVHTLIRSMRIAGFIKQNALGGYEIGPTPLPAAGRAVASPRAAGRESVPPELTDRFGRVWAHQSGDVYVHDKMAWLAEQVVSPSMTLPSRSAQQNPAYQWCDLCLRLFATAGPSGVVPGAEDDPDARQRAYDRAFLERLEASQAAGNLTSHDPGDACELGLWHEGPCPDVTLERQLVLDDRAEDRGGDRDDMETCGVHRKWAKDCVSSPDHSNPILKYNWCDLHSQPVQKCGCWTANLSGRPLPGDEPRHTDPDWVDWALDPRTRSEGLRGGMGVDTHRGYFRVLPHPDGRWRLEGPYGRLEYFPDRHQGLLAAVDGDLHRDAVRRPRRRVPSGVPQGVEPDADDPWPGGADAAGWSPADVPPSDEPVVRSGRRPRCDYLPWARSQLVNLGAASRGEHFWQCPTTGCKVWAGPYRNPSVAKQAGFEHVYVCEKTDYFGRNRRRPSGVVPQ